jgi:hypothetical protein
LLACRVLPRCGAFLHFSRWRQRCAAGATWAAPLRARVLAARQRGA